LRVIASLSDTERRGAEKPLEASVEMIYAAVTLHNLLKAGMKRNEAASKIARVASKGVSAIKIINYRENLHRKRAPERAVNAYWQAVTAIEREWGHLGKEARIREA